MQRSKLLQVVRDYWTASERQDWTLAGTCIGEGYEWVDHATGVKAKTPEELAEAVVDEAPWRDTKFEIQHAVATDDGALMVQALRSGRIEGTWRGLDGRGQRVSLPTCTIFRFDDQDRIIYEEAYYDMLSVAAQLGYAPETKR